MATNTAPEAGSATGYNKEYNNGTARADHEPAHGSHQERRGFGGYGNPLAKVGTGDSARLPAFGGEFQPGSYRPTDHRKFANPAPLGLSAFALTTFVLSLLNLNTRGLQGMNSIVIASAFGYGGLVQLLAGMWEMAVGNTFGATALSSYGGFWISIGITLTPGGFDIVGSYPTGTTEFVNAFGFFLMGWFIFTTILVICTLRSTVAFFFLFFTLDLAFLMLGIGYLHQTDGAPNAKLIKAGGVFGILAAFAAWYNALAGIADSSNSFFTIPVAHFPWSDKGRERRTKTEAATV